MGADNKQNMIASNSIIFIILQFVCYASENKFSAVTGRLCLGSISLVTRFFRLIVSTKPATAPKEDEQSYGDADHQQ